MTDEIKKIRIVHVHLIGVLEDGTKWSKSIGHYDHLFITNMVAVDSIFEFNVNGKNAPIILVEI
jgi:hypothetical protein